MEDLELGEQSSMSRGLIGIGEINLPDLLYLKDFLPGVENSTHPKHFCEFFSFGYHFVFSE
jgi:hypothetical protein